MSKLKKIQWRLTAFCDFCLMAPAKDFQFKLHWTLHKEKLNVIFIDCHFISKIFPCNIISCIINSYPIIDLFILVPEVAAKTYACSIWYIRTRCLLLKITCTCHQVKIKICCLTPMVAPNLHNLNMLNPNLPSDSISDHSRNTSFNKSPNWQLSSQW